MNKQICDHVHVTAMWLYNTMIELLWGNDIQVEDGMYLQSVKLGNV